jgi:hypothetical protein
MNKVRKTFIDRLLYTYRFFNLQLHYNRQPGVMSSIKSCIGEGIKVVFSFALQDEYLECKVEGWRVGRLELSSPPSSTPPFLQPHKKLFVYQPVLKKSITNLTRGW